MVVIEVGEDEVEGGEWGCISGSTFALLGDAPCSSCTSGLESFTALCSIGCSIGGMQHDDKLPARSEIHPQTDRRSNALPSLKFEEVARE
jgi:hypothetical protein